MREHAIGSPVSLDRLEFFRRAFAGARPVLAHDFAGRVTAIVAPAGEYAARVEVAFYGSRRPVTADVASIMNAHRPWRTSKRPSGPSGPCGRCAGCGGCTAGHPHCRKCGCA